MSAVISNQGGNYRFQLGMRTFSLHKDVRHFQGSKQARNKGGEEPQENFSLLWKNVLDIV